MKQSEITELISTLHKLVHKKLKGVASAAYVKDDYIYFELMFKFNNNHTSIYRKKKISVALAFDMNVVANSIFNEALIGMKNVMLKAYERKETIENGKIHT